MIINKNSRILVQGITGKEGLRATKDMIDYGSNVICGVTPGKGGTIVLDIPVFDSVAEAVRFNKEINVSVLYVPPLLVYDAVIEALYNGIKTIIIITENVPVKDVAKILELSEKYDAIIIGPSSVGVIKVGECKVGSIGGSNVGRYFLKGKVGIVSKSGGMSAETSLLLSQNGIGQSIVVGIGGELISCSTFCDMLKMFEKDIDTKVIVLFGEIGGNSEEKAAEMIKKGEIKKPVVAFVSGKFAQTINRSVALGHGGAIIERGMGGAESKIIALRDAGVRVANFHHEIVDLVREVLKE